MVLENSLSPKQFANFWLGSYLTDKVNLTSRHRSILFMGCGMSPLSADRERKLSVDTDNMSTDIVNTSEERTLVDRASWEATALRHEVRVTINHPF